MIDSITGKFSNLSKIDNGKIQEFIDTLLSKGTDGVGPLISAKDLANEYLDDEHYQTVNEKVNALIRWEASKNFSIGFLASIGGAITLPVSMPVSMFSSWVIQARLAATIAYLYGFSLDEDRVKTFILLSIIGDSSKDVLKDFGVNLSGKFIEVALKNIPDKFLSDINKTVGFRLLSKVGEDGAVNLMKIVPLAGGILSGMLDSISSVIVGKTAKAIFGKDKSFDQPESIYDITLTDKQISEIVSVNNKYIKSIELPENNIIRIKPSRSPISFDFKFLGYTGNVVKLTAHNNFITNKIINRGLDDMILNLPQEFRGTMFFKDGVLLINTSLLLEKNQSLKNIKIVDVFVKKGKVQINIE